MNEHDIFNAIGEVGDDLIEKAGATARRLKARRRIIVPLVAALIALILISGSAVGHIATARVLEEREREAVEYRSAVAFFEENGLSAEGLTNDELKTVYRDISSGAFAEPKTAEVLSELSLEKYLTELLSLNKKTLVALWNMHLKYIAGLLGEQTVKEKLVIEAEDILNSAVCCYDGDDLLWRYELPAGTSMELAELDDRVIAYGYTMGRNVTSIYSSSSSIPNRPLAIMLDKNGNELWRYDNSSPGSLDAMAVGDGELVFFGRVYQRMSASSLQQSIYTTLVNKLRFTRMSLDGEVLEEKDINFEVPVTTLEGSISLIIETPKRALKTSAGYLVQTSSTNIMLISHAGEHIKTLKYRDDAEEPYQVNDMILHGDRVLLSVTTVPDEAVRDRINDISIEFLSNWPEGGEEPPFEGEQRDELISLLRGAYSSAILLCDTSGNALEELAYLPGVLCTGATLELSVDESGNIRWTLQELIGAKPQDPALSSRGVVAELKEYEFILSVNGTLIGRRAVKSFTEQILYS